MVEHLKLQRLVLLEVIVEDERFLEVRIQIVGHNLGAVGLGPLAFLLVALRVQCHERISFAYVVQVNQVAARYEQLHLQPRVVQREHRLLQSRVKQETLVRRGLRGQQGVIVGLLMLLSRIRGDFAQVGLLPHYKFYNMLSN